MLIHVTQSHIDRGCRGDGQACPVALALSETLGCLCTVDRWLIFINVGPDHDELCTPSEVAKRIVNYDETGFMEPFEFELDVEGVAT